MKKDLETMAAESAAAVAQFNNLSPDMEALLHTQFIAGFTASIEHDRSEMTFGKAIKALKEGKKVRREDWPEDSFLWLKPAAIIKAEWCKDPILKHLAEKNGGSIEAQGTVCVHINGIIVSGFTPMQEDMLSEDWEIV